MSGPNRFVARGSYLWHQGDPGRVVAQLQSGKWGFEINNQSVGVLYPPVVIGESALLEDEGETRPPTPICPSSKRRWWALPVAGEREELLRS